MAGVISTRDLSGLPGVDRLRRTLQSMAVLDAILSPEWRYRYYSFDAGWAAGEQLASVRNGSGDHLFACFTAAGAWVKGFDHESPRSHAPADGLFVGLPAAFSPMLSEPAFMIDESTFCLWRQPTDDRWHQAADVAIDDGSADLLGRLDASPDTYCRWAEVYFECDVPADLARDVYAHRPLDWSAVRRFRPDLDEVALSADLNQIGYPAAGRDER